MGIVAIAVPGAAALSPSSAEAKTPIADSKDLFSVRRIYCIGRNYAVQSREIGSDPTREPHFFFKSQQMLFKM
jgi:2-keto-4-pentenoate hydratase/2-oxohepta-3-ene-1,7-dioic acid hydratase in catechol pathway